MNFESLARTLQQGAQGRRYFGGTRKGENYELRADLNSEYADIRKDAVKRVIANMTVGKDVSGLFPDVLKNMQTEDVELKKLVYLYLINYSKTQPELVILAVNTFVKDADDSNPLIRALAIRTMGCLRAERILDYLCDPLRRCLRDDNPYVRKTAAITVVKLYDLKPELCIEQGFIDTLRDLIGDNNPMVVANAVTALMEIEESSNGDENVEKPSIVDSSTLPKLLVALGECTEWGRIAILEAVAAYKPRDAREAETICERVIPQFQHANGSVVLAAIKVIMIHIRHVTREDFVRTTMRKMAPPLVTLVSSPPEIQWIALRNINLILQKRPDALTTEMRVFFCKYNDPPYVKVEKLDIMIKLASPRTVDMLLSELREYASEVDVEFVRRAIKAIGQCAIKIEDSAGRCVELLLELINTKVSYVVQEAIIVVKDIFRKYPHRYEGVIPTLCEALEDLDEPEAKASLIWIVGEYAGKIDNADALLSSFLDSFVEEPVQVQLQTLTAVVKLYVNKPDESQTLVQRVLSLATKSCDSPDVRDRAYIYWRLLSSDAAAAKKVVVAMRPPISIPSTVVSPALLDELISELGTLASAYFKPPEVFIGRGRLGADELQRKAHEAEVDTSREKALQTVVAGQNAETLLDFDAEDVSSTPASTAPAASTTLQSSTSGGGDVGISSNSATSANPLADLMGLFDSTTISNPSSSSPGFPGNSTSVPPMSSTNNNDALNSLDMSTESAPSSQPPAQSAPQKDLLDGLF